MLNRKTPPTKIATSLSYFTKVMQFLKQISFYWGKGGGKKWDGSLILIYKWTNKSIQRKQQQQNEH